MLELLLLLLRVEFLSIYSWFCDAVHCDLPSLTIISFRKREMFDFLCGFTDIRVSVYVYVMCLCTRRMGDYQFIVGLTNSIPKQTMLNFTGKGIYVSKRLVAHAKNGRNLKMGVIT